MKIKPGKNPSKSSATRQATCAQTAAAALSIRKILVPIDFSACSLDALNYALRFARLYNAKTILLHVVEPTVTADNYLSLAPTFDEANQNLLEMGRERLEELAANRIGPELPAETLVRMGRAHSEIPDTAKALGADLIIIATHGNTGLAHVVLGSTAEKVIRHAPCPVLTVRQSEQVVTRRQ